VRMTIAAATALTLLNAPARAQDVTYDYDKATDFSAFHTYAWVDGTPARDQLTHRRIVAAVDSELMTRGMTRVEMSAHPDVVVAYHAGISRSVQVSGLSTGWGGRVAPARSGTARTEEILTGVLAVEVLEPWTGMVMWHGIVSKDLDLKADPEKRERNINKAVGKLFQHYPAGK
jgi:hypothetical protein